MILGEHVTEDRPQPLAMSVVVVTPGGYESISRTVDALRRQTIADRLELVVVAPEREAVAARLADVRGFHSVRIVPLGPITNVDHAAAPGLLSACGEIVASIEDHAFPEPDWAERLLAEWTEPGCVAVGSSILNANPRSALSWTNMMIAYHQWAPGTPPGEIDWVPAHNISLRRSALLPLGNDLAKLMGREGLVLKELRRRGGRFRFAADARIAHVNPSTLRSTAALRFDAGRLYGARRAAGERWPVWKRSAYAALSPLIPFVRYRRMRTELFAPGRPAPTERRHGPALFAGLIFDAAGQAVGYLFGVGGSADRLAVFEINRLRHITRHDRRMFAPL